MDVSTIVSRVYEIWEKPSYQRLPVQSVVNALNRSVNSRLAEMQLSSLNYFATVSAPFYITERSIAPPVIDISVPLRVESRVSGGTEDDWEEEQTVDFADWNRFIDKPGNFVAFYGVAPDLTMRVNRDVTGREFRIIYETDGVTSLTIDGELGTAIPQLFYNLLEYDVAMEAGMLIQDHSPEFLQIRKLRMEFLGIRRDESLALWQRWILSRKPQSVTTREAFNSRRNRGLSRKDGQRGWNFE